LVKEIAKQAEEFDIRHMDAEQRHGQEMARVLAKLNEVTEEGVEQPAEINALKPEEPNPPSHTRSLL
jgi:hypothetical protein